MQVRTSLAGTAEIRASPSGSRSSSPRGAVRSIATGRSSASDRYPLNEGLRGFVARAGGALCGHEKTAVRALEPLVPRAFGEQLAVEGLLAVWADNHLRSHVPITRKPHFWFRGGVACDADAEAVPASPVRPSKPRLDSDGRHEIRRVPQKGEASVAFLDHSVSSISLRP